MMVLRCSSRSNRVDATACLAMVQSPISVLPKLRRGMGWRFAQLFELAGRWRNLKKPANCSALREDFAGSRPSFLSGMFGLFLRVEGLREPVHNARWTLTVKVRFVAPAVNLFVIRLAVIAG